MSTIHTSSEQSSPSSLVNRYGAPKRGLPKQTRRVLLIAALSIAVIAAGIMTFLNSTPAVTSKDVGFHVTDATSVAVDFRVTKDPSATAQCAVQVLSSNYAVVGWTTTTVAPTTPGTSADEERTTAERVDVRTASQGVTGGVNSCWIVDGGS